MKLHSLQLTNFRCFESLTVEFDPQLTVLVSNNGMGKTAVLEALATGLDLFLKYLTGVAGRNLKETDIRLDDEGNNQAYMRIRVETTDRIVWDRTKPRNNIPIGLSNIPSGISYKEIAKYANEIVDERGQNKKTFPLIAYYGTGRAVFDVPQNRNIFRREHPFNGAYKNALDAKPNFRRFFEYFYFLEDLERRDKEEYRNWDYRLLELEIIRCAISRMMPEFSNPHSELRPLRFMVYYNRKNLRIEQLSDGYRTTLALVMDIASRLAGLAEWNKNPITGLPTVKQALDNVGIVLIDEIDLHLHPSWQQRILPDLMRTFPNIQFIVTTHSPQVLTTVRRENIRVIGPNILNQIIAEPPQAMTYCQPSGDVMQSVMRVDPQPPGQDGEKADLERLTELVDQGCHDKDEAQKLQRRLVIKLGEQHPQLQRLERSIKRQERIKNEEHKKRLQ